MAIRFFYNGPTQIGAIGRNSSGDLILSVSDGGGIDFSATSGTGTSELLDDYEEGTWTPVYGLSTTDFDNVTYDVQSARYTKIGRVIYCEFEIRTDSITVGSGSGSAYLGGLPYVVSGTVNTMKPGRYVSWSEVPGALRPASGSTVAYLVDEGTTSTLTSAAFNTGSNSNLLSGQFFYFTNT